MTVIVSLFRVIIGAGFLLYSFGLAFVLGMSLSGLGGEAAANLFGGLGIYLALALFTALVLFCGIAAILVSCHDRMCDMAATLREQTELLRKRSPD